MKQILILGGTNFIGRNLVEKLLELKEFELTLFNRQVTHTGLFPKLHKIKGDRNTADIDQIADKKWDYVIDLSCYFPNSLKQVLEAVKSVEKYVFVSTCSVYDNEHNQTLLRNEEADILNCNARQATDESPASYGNRKAECERILKTSGIPHVIFRPALVFGQYDPTDRMYYWLHQEKTKDLLLLPEKGKRVFSTTYVFDLVEAIIQSIKNENSKGVFNVVTHPKTSIDQITTLAGKHLNKEFSIIDAPADFLIENEISQWTDIPLWLKADYFTYSNQKMVDRLNVTPTPFEIALGETIAYYNSLNWPEPKFGMSEAKRSALINQLNSNS